MTDERKYNADRDAEQGVQLSRRGPTLSAQNKRKYSFDDECFYLAEHFFGPDAPVELLNDLAQRVQDQVEASPELDAWLEAKVSGSSPQQNPEPKES